MSLAPQFRRANLRFECCYWVLARVQPAARAGISTLGSAAATIGSEPAMPSTESDSLDRLSPGLTAVIAALDFEEADRVRLMELGFIPGSSVSCQRVVPLGDLAIFQVEGTQIALRKETAARITLQPSSAGRNPDADGG
ncbi:MAG: ferrous iron transport protein A [Acidobacteriia bacterium]|nr:ferrous iron transport protein A [Terriglobia bacterium]